VFVYYPSRGFVEGIRRKGNYQLRLVHERPNLWRLESTGQRSEGEGLVLNSPSLSIKLVTKVVGK